MASVTFNHVYKRYPGGANAVKDLDIEVADKEFLVFVGPSGCGKTTFLRVMADLEQPTSGSITINGKTPDEARKSRAYGYALPGALTQYETMGQDVLNGDDGCYLIPIKDSTGYAQAALTEPAWAAKRLGPRPSSRR